MRHIFLIFPCIVIGSLFGCSSKTFVISDDYKGKELRAPKLMVVPYAVRISNKDDVTDDLGEGNEEDVFRKYFENIFSARAIYSSRIHSCQFGKNISAGSLSTRELAITKKNKFKISIPNDGEVVEIDSMQPEYLLFIDDFSVGRTYGSPGVWTPGLFGSAPTYSGGSSGGLNHQMDFVLWDNVNGKIVSYGNLNAQSENSFFVMTKENWNTCVKDLAQQFVRATPFNLKSSGNSYDTYTDTTWNDLSERQFYFKAKAGGDFIFHLRDQDQENPNIPDQFESLEERPSVAYFFDDGSGYHFDAAGSLLLNEDSDIRLLFGCTYEHNTSMNRYHNHTDEILGNELTINNIGPYIGIESELSVKTIFAYCALGPSFKSYQGRYTQGVVEWVSSYSAPTAFRISGGIEKRNFFLPEIFINAELL